MQAQFNRNLREIGSKKSIIECAPTDCSSLEQQYNLFSKLYPYYIKKGISETNTDPEKLNEVFKEALRVSELMVPQTSLQLSFSSSGIYETKTMHLLKEKDIITEFPEIYFPVSIVINELLIRPHLSQFHQGVFTLMRRLYHYFPSLRPHMGRPLMIMFTNIALFGSEEMKKLAAIFLYQLVHQIKDERVIQLLQPPVAKEPEVKEAPADPNAPVTVPKPETPAPSRTF